MLRLEKDKQNPSIMEPMESLTLVKAELSDAMKPDIVNDTDLKSIPFIPAVCEDTSYDREYHNHQKRSFLLMDGKENLLVSTAEIFRKKLGCTENDKIKVVSIFGKTGDGKSHTMNHIFFNGEEVFRTSFEQNSCTLGVWAAMQPKLGVLCLDTEGLLGTTDNPNRRMRMLLKILAISDIVIYRTRAERLHNDMFEFLDTASKAFCLHFAAPLQSLVLPGSTKTLGPAVIIFHETRDTIPLISSIEESAEDNLRKRFSDSNLDTDAFSSLRYVGIRTETKPTDYSKIFNAICLELENTSVRSSRQPDVVFKVMKALNIKFSGEITEKQINPFPEQYFTCTVTCESCGCRCQRSMGHVSDGENHSNSQLCLYQYQYDNKVYLCKTCHINGRKTNVAFRTQTNNDSSWYGLAKYAWKGSVIECPHCGEIYRSRQFWYGNKSPEDIAVRSETVHVWKGGNIIPKGPIHSAQMVLDGVSYIGDFVCNIGSPPTRAISDWIARSTAPSYWKDNNEITNCHACRRNFEKTGLLKHHCRACGEGFCNSCSKNKMPVPSRGWDQPVRVCNDCKQQLLSKQDSKPETEKSENISSTSSNTGPPSENNDVIVRKYGEVLVNAISSVAPVLEYPKDFIKSMARPTYWVADENAPNCSICKIQFGTAEELENSRDLGVIDVNRSPIHNTIDSNRSINGDCRRHHCRACGQAVCELCSTNRRPVPERGWTTDVRVCDACTFDKSKTD